jgi:L,D-peptidoglycan transpeptidase YkuD (ErfK/YbiS/YcfS/YnhG family)
VTKRGASPGPGSAVRAHPQRSLAQWAKSSFWLICCALSLASCATQPAQRQRLAWADARQLVLVVTPDWDADHGIMRVYARDAGDWQPAGETTPVVIGRAGAAWGLGLHPPQPGPAKQEGDGRSPAGAFAIGSAFGYAESASTGLPYLALSAQDYCIDVSGSPFYNLIVDKRVVGAAAVARSTEPMRRDLLADGDQAYKVGFVIEHNPRGVTGAGSCIFAHLWKSADSATAGCTAMPEPSMRTLLTTLKASAHPVFVLLPRAEYERLRAAWQLPSFPSP